jgi:hypothetical protein
MAGRVPLAVRLVGISAEAQEEASHLQIALGHSQVKGLINWLCQPLSIDKPHFELTSHFGVVRFHVQIRPV